MIPIEAVVERMKGDAVAVQLDLASHLWHEQADHVVGAANAQLSLDLTHRHQRLAGAFGRVSGEGGVMLVAQTALDVVADADRLCLRGWVALALTDHDPFAHRAQVEIPPHSAPAWLEERVVRVVV